MTDPASPREVAAAWLPQLPGTRAPRDVPDAIVEPDWGGTRVVAALTRDEAALYAHGEEVAAPEELLQALLTAFTAFGAMSAGDAVIEGHLTTAVLRSDEGAYPALPRAERPPFLIPRAFRQGAKDDPFIRARDHVSRAQAMETATLVALPRGEPHAFVATDLLWLDGQSLVAFPLLERKRHLASVLEESHLVRVTVFVRPSTVATLVAWGTLGLRDLSYRAANSRYLPGVANPDWAIGTAPDSPARAPKPRTTPTP